MSSFFGFILLWLHLSPCAYQSQRHTGGSTSRKILRFVDKIAKSKYFQKATENEFIKKKIAEVSNMPLMLSVEVLELSGTLAINIPPPPTDRIWYWADFFSHFYTINSNMKNYLLCCSHTLPPSGTVSGRPPGWTWMCVLRWGSVRSPLPMSLSGSRRSCSVSSRSVLHAASSGNQSDFIEPTIYSLSFAPHQKVFVMPNMDDLYLPLMTSSLENSAASRQSSVQFTSNQSSMESQDYLSE